MLMLVLALLIGITAGLSAVVPLAILSCAAVRDWLPLAGTPMAFMGHAFMPWILVACAIGELVNDKLSKTPSRMIPMQFGTRLLSGAWTGATLGAAHATQWSGLLAGQSVQRSAHGLDIVRGGPWPTLFKTMGRQPCWKMQWRLLAH